MIIPPSPKGKGFLITLRMKVSFRSKKRVVTDYFVHIGGSKFEFSDVLAGMRCIDDRCSDIVITDKEMIKVFKEQDIIEFEGSRDKRIGARFGKNGKRFLTILEEKEEKIYKEIGKD